ncbi:MAG: asparagine synthase (glutamine-hydrolyzing) [Deltaproteobacteria bacterium]|nr:asparagine synthase (glutamine-hydrolyzing) [Deltaproteobacteria bacterium]
MCGIAGFTFDKASIHISHILDSLNHRGPDARGSVEISAGARNIWLGHTRLSILDLSPAGAQPMRSVDGRWWITYNGEVYNHQSLRGGLSAGFRGHSDTETIVESLAATGLLNTLPLLNGMFAFSAVDTVDEKLYLVRDPFGIKPLYYAPSGAGHIAFASEARALRRISGAAPEVDLNAVQNFLTLRYVPSPATLWKGIKRLPPGHVLTVDLRTQRTELASYIRPSDKRFKGSLDEAVEEYHKLLGRAVDRQLLSDVPVGLFLSGGIDSSIIAALLKERGRAVPAFTVGFGKGHRECEIEDAAETARVLGFPHVSITLGHDDLWGAFEKAVRSIEEPLGTTSILPMWHLAQKARRDVTVVLTGQGSDEPWGGYNRYQVEVLRKLIPFPSALRPFKSLGGISGAPEFVERGLRCMPEGALAKRFKEAYSLFSSKERRLLTGDAGDGGAEDAIERWLGWAKDADVEPVEKMMMIDSRMGLADDLLLYGDKISMAASLEARVPMLDLEVVAFIESLPRKFKLALKKTKIAHKMMAKRYLPPSIVNRPKKGFQVPFTTLARGEWKGRIEEIILDSGAPYFSLFKRNAVEALWKGFTSGKMDYGRKFFALLALCTWWNQQSYEE